MTKSKVSRRRGAIKAGVKASKSAAKTSKAGKKAPKSASKATKAKGEASKNEMKNADTITTIEKIPIRPFARLCKFLHETAPADLLSLRMASSTLQKAVDEYLEGTKPVVQSVLMEAGRHKRTKGSMFLETKIAKSEMPILLLRNFDSTKVFRRFETSGDDKFILLREDLNLKMQRKNTQTGFLLTGIIGTVRIRGFTALASEMLKDASIEELHYFDTKYILNDSTGKKYTDQLELLKPTTASIRAEEKWLRLTSQAEFVQHLNETLTGGFSIIVRTWDEWYEEAFERIHSGLPRHYD